MKIKNIFIAFCIIAFIYFIPLELSGSELDMIIMTAVTNSLTVKNIQITREIADLKRKHLWYSLLPSIGLTSIYNFESDTGNGRFGILFMITKSFGDVEGTYLSFSYSENEYLIYQIMADDRLRDFVDSLIIEYSGLTYYYKEKEIIIDKLVSDLELLTLITERAIAGNEAHAIVEEFSNQVILKNDDLEMDKIGFQENLDKFSDLSGYSPTNYELTIKKISDFLPQTKDITNDNQYISSIKKHLIELSNKEIEIEAKKRGFFIPIFSVQGGVGFDFWQNKFTYNVGAGVSYPIFELFTRQDEIKILSFEKTNIMLQISRDYRNIVNTYRLMEKELRSMEKRLDYLAKNISLEKELQNRYIGYYIQGSIDFYDLKKRLDEAYYEELDLLSTRKRIFILQKRMEYGILKNN